MAVKAVNDTAGPNGFVPTLPVFGAYPRMHAPDPLAPSVSQRAAAIEKAMDEVGNAGLKDRSSTHSTPGMDPWSIRCIIYRQIQMNLYGEKTMQGGQAHGSGRSSYWVLKVKRSESIYHLGLLNLEALPSSQTSLKKLAMMNPFKELKTLMFKIHLSINRLPELGITLLSKRL